MTKKITLLTLLLTFMSFITLEMKGAEEAIAVAETAVEETAEEAPAFTTVEEFQSMPVAYPKFMVDNLWILLSAALVFIMHLGFATLESGLTRQKNTVNILFKNVFIISMGVLSYAMWGFISMYPGDAWTITGFLAMGSPIPNGFAEGADSVANLTNQYADYTYWSDFIFQAMFAATAATIVSGAVAERIKLGSFMIGATVLVMIGYPITGSWHWGGGWLSEMGFADFAGSTLVHAFGGFAALAAVLLLGARRGKYVNGQIKPILGHSMPLATIGVFMLFLGWFGFNGGSVLSADPAGVSLVFVTTAMAGCAGGLAAALFSWIFLKKPDLSMALNGLLAGLVGITAGADVIPPWAAVITGAIAGVLVVLSVVFFDKIKIDDPVGAISVHGVCGIWGTLAVGIFGGANFVTQLIGTAAISAFAFAFTFIVFGIIKAILGLRVTEEEEEEGLDVGEHGISGYPNFQPAVDH
ncbi:MAG: ammonium transporter [Limisphaerales bacterium]|nr:ammonium transporter [Pedosphaera sp.]RZO69643.1 MAG: ammonium transporter [Limisphaerales bacterium]HCZ02365.1 ammonium transporter [Verrucomicrobiales bacterium]|tara:strand:+ start:548 stop:1954 length:1407 start_codon:yes stop_codon:yes gene_type:complete